MAIHDILLATGNPGKAREMREILGGETAEIRWHLLDEFEPWPEPVEDADDFLGNAAIKATYYALKSGMWTIADDSGLEVDALYGEPGVFSARSCIRSTAQARLTAVGRAPLSFRPCRDNSESRPARVFRRLRRAPRAKP